MRLTAKNAGMEKGIKDRVKKALDTYLEANNLRKTPERYAVLNAIYNAKGHLSLDDLEVRVEKEYFRVSRATLYNTIRLFMKLGLVVRHTRLEKITTTIVIRCAQYAERLPKCTCLRWRRCLKKSN